jgi:iron(III) transport system ATP-binding protein
MTVLELDGVSRVFGGAAAVDSVGLTVAAGEVVCLVGPSGCGKTTTLRLAAGLEAADAGRISVEGRLVDGDGIFVAPEQRRVGLVFQDYALFPHLSVLENVTFGLRGRTAGEGSARELLARVGMERHAKAHPHTLSGGEQQRVALARALAPRPAVMLMDEPFSGLDFRLRDQVGEKSLSLLRELGAATLMVTHDSEEAMRLADRIVLLRAGRIVQEGGPEELYRVPVDAFAAEFFSEINRLTGTARDGRVATPLGPVAAPGFADGTAVTVVIRPEAVHMGADGGPKVTVAAVRPMGPFTLARLKPDGSQTTLVMRLFNRDAPKPGAEVPVRLAPEGCHVFSEDRRGG